MTLAICLALKPSFLLLDEPTSALDHEAAVRVERLLRDSKAACIWVTHEDAQVSRIGGRALQLPLGTEVGIEACRPTHSLMPKSVSNIIFKPCLMSQPQVHSAHPSMANFYDT